MSRRIARCHVCPEPGFENCIRDESQHPQVDDPFDYVDFVNEQKAFRQAYRNCPITELPIHAVQTGREVLFFSNSPLGLQGLKQFYQELVNGYFSVHSERDPVCEYSVS